MTIRLIIDRAHPATTLVNKELMFDKFNKLQNLFKNTS